MISPISLLQATASELMNLPGKSELGCSSLYLPLLCITAIGKCTRRLSEWIFSPAIAMYVLFIWCIKASCILSTAPVVPQKSAKCLPRKNIFSHQFQFFPKVLRDKFSWRDFTKIIVWLLVVLQSNKKVKTKGSSHPNHCNSPDILCSSLMFCSSPCLALTTANSQAPRSCLLTPLPAGRGSELEG